MVVSTATGCGGVIGDAYKHHFISSSASPKSLDLFHGALATTREVFVFVRVDESDTTDASGDDGGDDRGLILVVEGRDDM